MIKAARVVNWLCLILGAVAAGLILNSAPKSVILVPLVLLLPFALALVALRTESTKIARWAALAANAIYFVFAVVGLIVALVSPSAPGAGVAILAVLAALYGANAGALRFGGAVSAEQSADRAASTPKNDVDQQMNAWLKETRAATKVQFKPGAFQ